MQRLLRRLEELARRKVSKYQSFKKVQFSVLKEATVIPPDVTDEIERGNPWNYGGVYTVRNYTVDILVPCVG